MDGGPKVIERLSADLRAAFPGARGYSVSSLRYMRAFAAAWPERAMLQSGVGALPWGHIVLLLDRLADRSTRDWYAARASSWSRVQLETAIMSYLHEREGAAVTNFERTLEAGDAEAVQRIARDPVVLDFVQLTDGAKERDLEAALLVDIERFMLAVGEGFYFAGCQKSLEIGGEEFIGGPCTCDRRIRTDGSRRNGFDRCRSAPGSRFRFDLGGFSGGRRRRHRLRVAQYGLNERLLA